MRQINEIILGFVYLMSAQILKESKEGGKQWCSDQKKLDLIDGEKNNCDLSAGNKDGTQTSDINQQSLSSVERKLYNKCVFWQLWFKNQGSVISSFPKLLKKTIRLD